jgi:hypothetical protein
VTKAADSRRLLERTTTEGDSPVGEIQSSSWKQFPSTAGHVQSRGKPGGPSPKAKYALATDSELVPRGAKVNRRRVLTWFVGRWRNHQLKRAEKPHLKFSDRKALDGPATRPKFRLPVSKGMLTALNNQTGLSADQQEKAKPIIDKHVADLEAVKNDTTLDKAAKKAKVVELRQQYVTDINGILTPDQQKKWETSREANKAKIKAHMAKKAAEKAPQ